MTLNRHVYGQGLNMVALLNELQMMSPEQDQVRNEEEALPPPSSIIILIILSIEICYYAVPCFLPQKEWIPWVTISRNFPNISARGTNWGPNHLPTSQELLLSLSVCQCEARTRERIKKNHKRKVWVWFDNIFSRRQHKHAASNCRQILTNKLLDCD